MRSPFFGIRGREVLYCTQSLNSQLTSESYAFCTHKPSLGPGAISQLYPSTMLLCASLDSPPSRSTRSPASQPPHTQQATGCLPHAPGWTPPDSHPQAQGTSPPPPSPRQQGPQALRGLPPCNPPAHLGAGSLASQPQAGPPPAGTLTGCRTSRQASQPCPLPPPTLPPQGGTPGLPPGRPAPLKHIK